MAEFMKEFLSAILIGLTFSGCTGVHIHRISKDEARVVLTAFVNQEFERKTLADLCLPREGCLRWPRLSERDLPFAEFLHGRWVVSTEPRPPGPAYTGFYVRASVDEFGNAPRLEVARFYLP